MKTPKRQKRQPHNVFRSRSLFSGSASFKRRLFLSFLLIAIPLIASVCAVSFYVLQQSTRETILQSQVTEMEKLNAQLESMFQDTEVMSREILYNASVQDYMTEANATESYPDDSGISYYINGLTANREYIDSVVLITETRTVFSTENAYSDRSAFQNIEEKWWYEELTGENFSYSWFPYAKLTADQYLSQQNNEIPEQINTLMLARPIYSTDDYRTLLGYLMIYLDEEYIEQIWQDISWGTSTNIFIYDESYNLVAYNSRLNNYEDVLTDPRQLTGSRVIEYEDTKYILTSTEMSVSGWNLYMVTPLGEVNTSYTIMMQVFVSSILIIFAVICLLLNFSANNMARPITNLSRKMDTFHGTSLPTDPKAEEEYRNRSDEVGQIYRSYDQLADRMDRLIQEIYVKNLEKKDAELALLQTQINPHFLYNTLDSINWIALANGQDEISEMITALSDTFRLSLMKNNSSFVEMEQEINYIQSYLTLQKFRYADRLTCTFDIPEPIPKLFIPRFILQPVVENALKHGIDQLENGGEIRIRITTDTQIQIDVINDGTKIDLKKMEEILVFHPEDSDILNFKKEGYGVQNIHRRIKIICGDDYGLRYEKTAAQTICHILLPRKETL